MRCPACKSDDLRVLETRDQDDAIRRRRECGACGHRFSTTERADAAALWVVKRDGRREPYSRAKIIAGVRIACQKRPISIDAIERLASQVEHDLARLGRAELPSTRIGDLVMEHLVDLDAIAYIRFASVYRDMKNLESIRGELDRLLAQAAGKSAP